ncbi:hypothetical protein [Burkholderia lata]|uniref:hypothetical protein n=1 Tax=Burkholderia lata (strain ATCC 17760 / DSM 23089 / LMG 22485 / NCIMB 9086 / R18194 / 383) TaxID=482957 RepID=UPI0014530D44|nr:hypothetical protein [Burkholderia lata]VWM06631.1 hypothetical protein BLA6992_02420 [Burkholderia lata]
MTRAPWTPDGFDDWRRHYPATPFARAAANLDRTDAFIDGWTRRTARLPLTTTVVLVAGLYSEWLPGCNRGARQTLGAAGYRVLTVPVRSARGVFDQGAHIGAYLRKHLPAGGEFVALAHSKGGIDTLAALVGDPALAARCTGLALMQPPCGPSAIVDTIFRHGMPPHVAAPWPDRIARRMLRTRWADAGTRDISSRRDPRVGDMLAALPRDLHLVHGVSWSVEASTRFDSHHGRLNGHRPGCAHDGQFYLEHQVMAGIPQVCLPRLDHGQPVLGGLGFDAGRFWLALADLLHVTRAQTR